MSIAARRSRQLAMTLGNHRLRDRHAMAARPLTNNRHIERPADRSLVTSCQRRARYDVVMDDQLDVNAVAEVMVRTFKGRAISTLEDRVSVFNLAGDVRAAKFFWLVAKAVREIEARP